LVTLEVLGSFHASYSGCRAGCLAIFGGSRLEFSLLELGIFVPPSVIYYYNSTKQVYYRICDKKNPIIFFQKHDGSVCLNEEA
jgi:hypothetical protein